MNCIILGDKFQKGMKSKGCAALISLNKKHNILQHQYNVLKSSFENINITYIYGFDSKKFIDFCKDSDLTIDMIYNQDYNNYNEAFSLSLAKNILEQDETLIIDGYVQFNKNIFRKFDRKIGSQVFIGTKDKEENSVGCIIHDNYIENFSFDLDNNIEQIYYLNKDSSLKLKQVLDNTKYNNCFIFELLNILIDSGHTIKPKNI